MKIKALATVGLVAACLLPGAAALAAPNPTASASQAGQPATDAALAAAGQRAEAAQAAPQTAPGAIAGAACADGQAGVTVAVDFYPLRDQLDIRCTPGATGSPADAFAAAGFDFGYNSWGMVAVIDGVDAAELGPQGWWTFLTSTSDGKPGGLPAAEWTDAMVGVADGHVKDGEAYMLRLLDTYDCWDPSSMEDPSVCVPRLELADVLDRDGSSTVPAPPWQGGAPADAAASAGWIAAQLAANGDVLPGAAGADWGLTIDALLGLAATGAGADQAAATAAKLAASGEAYIGAAGDQSKWAAVAKMALALQVAGLDPAAFPASPTPRNLIAELRAAQNADGSFGTSDIAFTHPLALVVLARTDGGVPPAATAWLAAQRCAEPDSPAFGSYGWTPGCDSPDPDSTAMAIQGLVAAGLAADSPAVADAVTWLGSQQDSATGGFVGSYAGANANTTGLAANSLRLAGASPASLEAAAEFIGGLTVSCANVAAKGSQVKIADVGAVAFDASGLAEAKEYGLDEANTDQFRRASAQAVLALGGPGLVDLTFAGAAAAAPAETCAPAAATPTADTPSPTSPTAPGSSASGTVGSLPMSGLSAFNSGLLALSALLVMSGLALVARRRLVLMKAGPR